MDTLKAKVRQGSGLSIDRSTLRCDWIDGGSNGIQTFFMTADELQEFTEKQMKRFGRINLRTMKTEKWVKDHWEVVDDRDEMEVCDED